MQKLFFFGTTFFFSVFWFVKRHSFKPRALHFQLNYECDVTGPGVIFTVPQICAYFVDNPHNLEIDSFKIAVSEHILLYFKNSNSFFFCVYMVMCGTRCVWCVSAHGVRSFSIGKHSTNFHRACVFIHIWR